MSLSTLPTEILILIQPYLDLTDIKHLRLSCRKLCAAIELRIDRVFLSANPRNVDVFLTIAAHETLRRFVTEIVWDDAVLTPLPSRKSNHDGLSEDDASIRWFVQQSEVRRMDIKQRWENSKRDDMGPSGHGRAQDSYAYYKELVRGQAELRQSGRHVDALRIGVRRFPALQRITVTPDANGGVHNPRYPSPMVREFPHGFIYPFPQRWTLDGPSGIVNSHELSEPWHRLAESEKDMWEGVRAVFKLLAEASHGECKVSELVLDAGILPTGISHRIFEEPCDELRDLTTLISRPGFRRLDLAVAIEDQAHQAALFRSELFRQALSGAKDLEHFRLQASSVWLQTIGVQTSLIPDNHISSLIHVFPVDYWPRLCHFGLSGMCVRSQDLITLLGAMPRTLRSVELDRLHFRSGKGSYGQVLAEAKYKLGWSRRQKQDRVKLTICTCQKLVMSGPFVRVSDEIQDYIYGDGSCPFQGNDYVGYEPASMVKFELRFP
ncbi:unnamed protein product [Clonostachys rosea]|uniref:F-box domain-containing protein n=1 Tax=Bionectria ochroleuca TaxID=29856 RepID=A0ABY6UDK1_BIOOC|nr:unnamed protein product [Clonostachys rosea]